MVALSGQRHLVGRLGGPAPAALRDASAVSLASVSLRQGTPPVEDRRAPASVALIR